MRYSSLEKRFDELTPDWIVSTGKAIIELGDRLDKKSKWDFSVPFSERSVSKARYEDGQWVDVDTSIAIPDFVVMSKSAFLRYSAMLARARHGLQTIDPFRHLGCKTGFYVEVHGDRFHSGKYVRGLSREEHESEMEAAYASAGAKVLQLWESDVNERWEEICLPLIKDFLKKASQEIDIPEWSVGKGESFLALDENTWKSLADSAYWKRLDKKNRNTVVENLLKTYDGIDFPYPDKNMAKSDFRRFCDWASRGTGKPTRFGSDCCKYYVGSVVDSRVRGKSSLREVWKDRELMRFSIDWQLSNENGSHHAIRFLNAMCHSSGFRVISNLHPSKVVCWLRQYSKVGGIFFDPCAGWGGRMLAAHALGMRYRAIDANPVLVGELNKMASELGIDAEVVYGSSTNRALVESLMDGEKADLIFTSPPYFNKEIYGDDPSQSIVLFPEAREWHEGFFGGMVRNAMDVLCRGGVAAFNVPKKFKLEWSRRVIGGVAVSDRDISIEHARRMATERIVEFRHGNDDGSEPEDFVSCRICHRRFSEIGWHLKKRHGMSKDDYLKEYPNALMISSDRSLEVPSSLSGQKRGSYKQRTAYRCPDGRIVKKRDAWKRAWAPGEPPSDSALDAEDAELDPFAGQAEGESYVSCNICGHKGKNITRHIGREHDLDTYKGPLKSELSIEKAQQAANKTWDIRGRKPERDRSKNKTHKVNALDEDTLKRLYVDDGLSDAKIGTTFGMTGEGVAYRRKKWGIETRKRIKTG